MMCLGRLCRRLRLNRARRFVLLTLFCVFALTFYLGSDYEDSENLQYPILSLSNASDEIANEYLVWNSKCHMLSMNPYDPNVMKFVKKEKFEACSSKPLLTSIFRESDKNVYLLINHDAAKEYKGLSCCWTAITRPNTTNGNDRNFDSRISAGACRHFKDRVLLHEDIDVILVICRDSYAGEIYKNIHAVIHPQRVLHRLQNSASHRKLNDKNRSIQKQKAPSVLILGMDSVSRLNFYRTMPETRSYFRKRQWIELRAYNKIADNTFPNLMAILTGQNETVANLICDDQQPYSLDHCPMIWYNFRNAGYVTAFAEDTAGINTFNNVKDGFINPPTDYYMRPYVLATEKLLKIRERFNWPYCTGPELSADRIFDAAVEFAKTFIGQPYFGFFWTNSVSHEYMNALSSYDTRFLEKLQDMEKNNIMNDSIVIVLSDHGMRYGNSRDTFIGWYEERLPFFYISLPQWFRDQNPEVYGALLGNEDRLTSPYDLYETLRDILKRAGGQAPPSTGCPKCSSLFKPVPSERGCKDAGISHHWCTCAGFEPYNVLDPIVFEGANKFVEYVNNFTEHYKTNFGIRLCSILRLKRILRVKKLIDFDQENSEKNILKLFYKLELMPGGGKFETTVTYHGGGKYTVREEEVSRINIYGHHATCVEKKSYRKYCQCRLNVAHFILKWF